MKKDLKDKKLISNYGRALRAGSIKSLVDFDEKLVIDFSFQLHNINDLVTEFNGVMPPNRISHYILAFIKNGNGKKTIGSYSFDIQPNMGMIFPKCIIHSTENWSKDTTGYMLTFNEKLFEDAGFPLSFLKLSELFRLSLKPYQVFEYQDAKLVEKLFLYLQSAKDKNEPYHKKLLVLKLSELILLYKREFQEKTGDSNKINPSDRFAESLEEKFRSERSVKYYADLLSIHPNHLNKIIKTSTGLSAKTYIHNRILQEAKYLLSSTEIPAKEIAYNLGFRNYNYFCRLFKQLIKQTPREYRTENI